MDLNKCKWSCRLQFPTLIHWQRIHNLTFKCLTWTLLFTYDLTRKAHAKAYFTPFFPPSPPISPSPRSKLMPHDTDRWIPANRVRRFVLKYQRPAGDSYHSSVCLCCPDLCLSFSSSPSSISLLLIFNLCPSVPSLPSLLFSLSISISPQCVCFPGYKKGGVGEHLARILGITYLTVFRAQMNHVKKKKSLFHFKGQTLVLVKIDLWIHEFSPVVGAPL